MDRNVRSKCQCSCVLQFTYRRAISCVLHRPTSQVIHRSGSYIKVIRPQNFCESQQYKPDKFCISRCSRRKPPRPHNRRPQVLCQTGKIGVGRNRSYFKPIMVPYSSCIIMWTFRTRPMTNRRISKKNETQPPTTCRFSSATFHT